MKKILVSIAVTSLLMTGCVDDSANYNDNIDRAYNVPAETLVANAEKELIDQMTTPNVNLNPFRYFSQYWAPTTYTTEARYRLSTRKVPDNHFRILYANVLSNLKSAEASIALEPQPLDLTSEEFQKRQNNKTAIAEILQVYTYQILVDTFGNIPYTDALNVDIALPKYDAGAAVYPKLIERLNAAIAIMDDSSVSFLSGDVVYDLLSAQGNRIEKFLKDDMKPEVALKEVFLIAFARQPSFLETEKAKAILLKSKNPRDGWEDILWGIVNSKEFLLRQ